jgi:ribose-phosphate pyrophosphokinase
MRVFALSGTQILGEHIAREMSAGLDPIEERDFPGGEHKSRPLVSVRGEDVYVIESLNATARMSPAERLVRLLFFLATCRENGALRITAIVPYLAFMRKEVQTKPRDPVTRSSLRCFSISARRGMVCRSVA